MQRTLILMRHGDASDSGSRDIDRPLSLQGCKEVSQAKVFLASKGIRPDHALASPTMRTRTTFELLGTGLDPRNEEVQYDGTLYLAGADTIREVLSTVPAERTCVLVVGHSPGLPALVHELVDEDAADPAAWHKVGRSYPTATMAVITFDSDGWDDLAPGTGRLVAAHRPLYEGR